MIEQIVGDIDDEFDIEEDDQNIRKEAEHQYAVRGVTRLEEFNEYFGTELADEDFDTVAGLVMKALGRLPRRGEAVTLAGLELRVVRVDRRRIDMLRVTCPWDLPPAAGARRPTDARAAESEPAQRPARPVGPGGRRGCGIDRARSHL